MLLDFCKILRLLSNRNNYTRNDYRYSFSLTCLNNFLNLLKLAVCNLVKIYITKQLPREVNIILRTIALLKALILDTNMFFFQVVIGLVVPLYISRLEFKSKEELQLMPQTEEEHMIGLEEENESVENNKNNERDRLPDPDVEVSVSVMQVLKVLNVYYNIFKLLCSFWWLVLQFVV